MAAQREEETETLILCVNNCGFYGSPATKNMCQSCFQAAQTRPDRISSTMAVRFRGRVKPAVPSERGIEPVSKIIAEVPATAVNRCSGCRRRVGLTGFRCRCGDLFCGEHRYSDRHDCTFDYKAAGRETIHRENPLVRASKIIKI